jgi:hypothetical protein
MAGGIATELLLKWADSTDSVQLAGQFTQLEQVIWKR